jgi:7,8-dihydro-6-hydroxymethylpterin dimethyltransferase
VPMQPSNRGLCNKCKARVPSEFQFRDGQVWIRKDCPTCGPNEALVSTDAKVWQAKRDLWHYVPTENTACTLNCDKCGIDHKPNMVFLDVTNRCNMNCPICIATIRGMGFDFNPPLEYFEKIFAALAKLNPQPVVQLFGGEPTVRDDLLDIIAVARKHGLRPHVVTNGVTLADEAYCKKLCDARVPTRFGFDGRNADIYERLRNNRWAYEKKMKALENLKKYSRRKHAIIATAAYGVNDQYIGDLIQFVHENRDLISDLGIIPLTENWEPGTFDAAKTTTMEDVEKMVQASVPGGEVEFIPAGLAYSMRKPRSFFRKNPRSEVLLLAGVHPNCESITLLVSDGKTYRSINHYLRKPLSQVAVDLAAISKKLEPKLDRLNRDSFFQRQWGRFLCIAAFLPWGLKTIRFIRLADGKPVRSLLKLMFKGLFRRTPAEGLSSSRRPRRLLRVAMLPFEEQHSVDAARMESCKAVFAYEDVDDGQVKTIPACLWYPYRNERLKKLSEKYGVVRGGKLVKDAL